MSQLPDLGSPQGGVRYMPIDPSVVMRNRSAGVAEGIASLGESTGQASNALFRLQRTRDKELNEAVTREAGNNFTVENARIFSGLKQRNDPENLEQEYATQSESVISEILKTVPEENRGFVEQQLRNEQANTHANVLGLSANMASQRNRRAIDASIDMAIMTGDKDKARDLIAQHPDATLPEKQKAILEADAKIYEQEKVRRISDDPNGVLQDYYSGRITLKPSELNACIENSSATGVSTAEDAVSGKKELSESDVDNLHKNGDLPNALEYSVAKSKVKGTFDSDKPTYISECLNDVDTLPFVDPDSKEGIQAALDFKAYWSDKIGLEEDEVNSVLGIWKTRAKTNNPSIDFNGMKSSLMDAGALNGVRYAVNLNVPDIKLTNGRNYSTNQTWNAKSVMDEDGKIIDKSNWSTEQKENFEKMQHAAKLDAEQNWFNVVQKWNGWRASEGSSANKVEQLEKLKKYIEDVTGKKVPLDISFMSKEVTTDAERAEANKTKYQDLATSAIKNGKRYRRLELGASDSYSQKYPAIGINQNVEDDMLVIGQSELSSIPQIARFMDEAGNIKPEDMEKAQAVVNKLCCDVSIGSGRKKKDYPFGRIIISPNGGGVSIGVGSAVRMKISKNGIMNAEIRYRFDGKYKSDDAEEAVIMSDSGKIVGEEGLLPKL